jgi:hypothetical protein
MSIISVFKEFYHEMIFGFSISVPLTLMHTAFKTCVMLLFLSVGAMGIFANQPDSFSWQRIEADMQDTGFGNSFFDSILAAKQINSQNGLRTVNNPIACQWEKTVYEIGWQFVNAGYAILTQQSDTAKNMTVYSAKAMTNNFVSSFYPVRDYIRSHVDSKGLYPLFFEQHISEGRYSAREWVVFNHENQKVDYCKKHCDTAKISMFSQDYISTLFYARTMPLIVGDTIRIQCYLHRKDSPVSFIVRGPEMLRTEWGKQLCTRVDVSVVGEGRGLSSQDNISIWFSTDSIRLPMLIKAKVKVGTVSARLIFKERL